MGYLVILTIVGFVGLSLRMLIIGEFELSQFLLLLVFPLVAIGLVLFQRLQVNKDGQFKPLNSEGVWAFRLGDSVFTQWKTMYAHQRLMCRFRRIYQSRWKLLVAESMRNTGRWYLNLMFEMKDGSTLVFKNPQENRLAGNDRWQIYRNNEQVGFAETDHSLKNATKLKGRLIATVGETKYIFLTYPASSDVKVYLGDTLVGKGSREKGYQFTFQPMTSDNEEEMYLACLFVLTTYYFNT